MLVGSICAQKCYIWLTIGPNCVVFRVNLKMLSNLAFRVRFRFSFGFYLFVGCTRRIWMYRSVLCVHWAHGTRLVWLVRTYIYSFAHRVHVVWFLANVTGFTFFLLITRWSGVHAPVPYLIQRASAPYSWQDIPPRYASWKFMRSEVFYRVDHNSK